MHARFGRNRQTANILPLLDCPIREKRSARSMLLQALWQILQNRTSTQNGEHFECPIRGNRTLKRCVWWHVCRSTH